MANIADSLKQINKTPGSVGAALVDVETGFRVAQIGGKSIDLTTYAEVYAKYIRGQETYRSDSSPEEAVEEIVVSSRFYYHLIYPVQVRVLKVKDPENFFFLITLKKEDANLALARSKFKQIVADFFI